jgi:hypothetical protein
MTSSEPSSAATGMSPLRSSALGSAGRSLSRNAIVPQPRCRPQQRDGRGSAGAAGLLGGSSGVSAASTSMLLARSRRPRRSAESVAFGDASACWIRPAQQTPHALAGSAGFPLSAPSGAGHRRVRRPAPTRMQVWLRGDRNRGKALAGWKSGLRWKRSSGLTTAATRNQPRCGGVGRLLDHAYRGSAGREAVMTASVLCN